MEKSLIQLPVNSFVEGASYEVAISGVGVSPHFTRSRLRERARDQQPFGEILVIVPARRLSWHRIQVPVALRRKRKQINAFIRGTLEDRLLDELSDLHFAIAPRVGTDGMVWVAVCDRLWLIAHLDGLAALGLLPTRLIPELSPDTAKGPLAIGHGDQPMLWLSSVDGGVWGLPLNREAVGSIGYKQGENAHVPKPVIYADPSGSRLVSNLSDLKVELLDVAGHLAWVRASDWDLLQGSLESKVTRRLMMGLRRKVARWWREERWRRFRYGVAALIFCNVVGLNVWVYLTRANWEAQQQQMIQVFRETFPEVKTVIDPHRQMLAEARNRLRGHQHSSFTFQSALREVSAELKPQMGIVREIMFDGQSLTASGLVTEGEELRILSLKLASKNLQLEATDGFWRLTEMKRVGRP
jgi:general secretion pathway protein L